MKLSIEALRANAGFNQNDMAQVLGITRQAYINKETGKTDFKWKEIKLIANAVKEKTGEKVSLDYIK